MENDRRRNQCPCGSKLFYQESEYIYCAKSGCENRWLAKRESDKNIPTLADIRKDWGEA